ncbi:MAG: hypothetical protein NTY35_12055 [Planctomycetota bacterium]|nr:hypothetical protein [Planctomycetota bacterium]
MLLALIALVPFLPLADGWRTDRVWYDGLAEKCTYEATRTIYGVERRYEAVAYTNKERVDPRTGVKTDAEDGIEVFKHHWSERVPTERYDYDFSTMTYTRVEDLAAWKLTAATQEDCGASFKEVWRDGGKLRWLESVYFPGAGRRDGKLDGDTVFFDALTLTLRGFDFDAKKDRECVLLPMQKDTHAVSFEPERRTIRFVGTSELELPVGRVRAHELALAKPDGTVEARYWFAADGNAPWLHALVRFEGAQGITYRLEKHERLAYWKR